MDAGEVGQVQFRPLPAAHAGAQRAAHAAQWFKTLPNAFIGIELDPEYFAIACKRVDEAMRQPDLFIAPPVKSVQEQLI